MSIIRKIAVITAVLVTASLIGSPTEMGLWKSKLDAWFESGKGPWRVMRARNARFTPDGRNLAIARLTGTVDLFRLSDMNQITVFDCSLALDDDYTRPVCLDFSPDGSRLAIGFWSGKTVLIADISGRRILKRIKLPYFPRKIRFSPKGRFLLTARSEEKGWNRIYSLNARKSIFRSGTQVPVTFTREDRYFFSMSARGNAWGIRMWESAGGRPLRYTPALRLGLTYPPQTLRSLRDHRIAVGTDNFILLTDRFFTEIKTRWLTPGHRNGSLVPSRDGKFLISCGKGKCRLIRLYDGRWKKLTLPTGCTVLDTYPNGNAYVYYNPGENSITVKRYSTRNSDWNR